MSQDESPRKPEKPATAAASDVGEESLDFSDIGPSKASAPHTAPVDNVGPAKRTGRRRKRAVQPGSAAADANTHAKPRRFVPLLVIVAIGATIAFFMTERAPEETKAPQPAPKSSKPPPFQPPTATPAPKAQTPAQSAPPPETQPPAIPAEFLKAYKDYAARSGNKAIALALDTDGRFAYAAIAGPATQKEASDEAISDCTRFRTQSGIKASCRLYAIGDKVVW